MQYVRFTGFCRRSLFGGVTGGVSDDLAEPQKFIADAKKAIAKSNAVLTVSYKRACILTVYVASPGVQSTLL